MYSHSTHRSLELIRDSIGTAETSLYPHRMDIFALIKDNMKAWEMYNSPDLTVSQAKAEITKAIHGKPLPAGPYLPTVRACLGEVRSELSNISKTSPQDELAKHFPYLSMLQNTKLAATATVGELFLTLKTIEGARQELKVYFQPPPARPRSSVTPKIFVVHGHHSLFKEQVARFIGQLGFTAVILQESASIGETIVEKFERESNVEFAIVLLTADDLATTKAALGDAPKTVELSTLAPRARQNVILELGYFIGKLGRRNVCAMREGSVDLPSDLLGLGFVELDQLGAWKLALARELASAGIPVTIEKLVGRQA